MAKRAPRTNAGLAAIAPLLALALVARLFAGPAFLPPPTPGLVPICAGGVIIYVVLPGYPVSVPVEDDEREAGRGAEACPWLGLAASPDLGAPAALGPVGPALARPTPAAVPPTPWRRPWRAHAPRGPPRA